MPRIAALCLALLVAVPAATLAAGVEALFDLSSPSTSPFPTDRFTAPNSTHLTRLRVNLPKPDCAVRPSDCRDIDVINTLDGFNLQPRLSIPFSGPIDPSSVDRSNLFLVSLGDTARPFQGFGHIVGINQVVWDPDTNTLHAESDEFLDEHTKYALIVTNGIRDPAGHKLKAGGSTPFRRFLARDQDPALRAYRAELLFALLVARVPSDHHVVAASVFTTLSATAVLNKIHRQIKRGVPDPADFLLGADGERTVFPLGSVSSVVFMRQVGTAVGSPDEFATSLLPLAALEVIRHTVGTIAFGRFRSPDYETAERFIPPVGTRTGVPAVQSTAEVYFNLFLPAAPKPPAGYPVAIFGHGLGDSKQGGPLLVAASMAAQGIATIVINVVGHGGGALGTLTVNRSGLPFVTLSAGGRGIDQDGDSVIDSTEGVNAVPPREIISNRDGLRQTVVDIMQLARVIETGGVDVDGDGFPDLDGSRIYYFGQSFGGIYGTILLGVESSLRAGVPNVGGGPIVEVARLSPIFRPLVMLTLENRTPQLLNAPRPPPLFGFNENMPLRNQPPVTNTVPGAMAIQEVFENTEWVSQSGNPVAYAPLIRKDPLDGQNAKPLIFQMAKGDKTVPNPTATNLIRAGDLADRVTYFRNDLAFAANPATPKDPHTFLINLFPPVAIFALEAQNQIATFFATDGGLTIDPDGLGVFFETPIVLPLPEELNFIP